MVKRVFGLFREAVRATWAAKTRAVLSAICIGLGISGVTLVTALGTAAMEKSNEIMEIFGTDAMMIFSGGSKQRAAGGRGMTISVDDVEGLKQNFPDAYLVVPMRSSPGLPVSYQNSRLPSEVAGISTSAESERGFQVEIGRDFIPEDNEFSAKVCVIGAQVRDTFFAADDPIGKQIQVGRSICEVVGVTQRKSMGAFDDMMNTFILIPESVFVKKYAWRKTLLSGVRMRFSNTAMVETHVEPVREYLRYRHNLQDGEEDDFRIVTSGMISGMFMAVLGAMAAFLGVITLVVVIVGGFVTANMLLLATQTRVKEIGIRRAFGATGRDIFIQFIIEFILVTLCGMLFALFLASVAAMGINSLGFVDVKITAGVFAVTAFASMVIALTFGIFPAGAAAKISPIEAIRSL